MTRVLDVLLACWVAAWIAIGALASAELRELRSLSDTVVGAGTALDQTGRAIQVLAAIPLVGEGPEMLARLGRPAAPAAPASGT